MGGGNTQTPVNPVAYRERDLRPTGGVEKGVEIIRTGQVYWIYWASSFADAVRLAELDGHDLSH